MTYPSEATEVVRLMKDVGLRQLMGSDGCWCGYTQLRGFHIDRSCHKSESSLRVYSHVLYTESSDLALIATEALKQMRAEDGWSHILVRYCEYSVDHFGSGWQNGGWVRGPGKCVYCAKPRTSLDAYLCKHCSDERDDSAEIRRTHDFTLLSPHGMQRGTRD